MLAYANINMFMLELASSGTGGMDRRGAASGK